MYLLTAEEHKLLHSNDFDFKTAIGKLVYLIMPKLHQG